MKELKEIITALKQTRTDTQTKVSDEIIFENAVKIFISDRINKKFEPKLDNELPPSEQAPTKKQIFFLKNNKLNIPKTKWEASKLIDKVKNENQTIPKRN